MFSVGMLRPMQTEELAKTGKKHCPLH